MSNEGRKIGRPKKFQNANDRIKAWKLKNPEKVRVWASKRRQRQKEELQEMYVEIRRARCRENYRKRKIEDPDYAKKRAMQERHNNPLRHFWRNKKYMAKKRGIEFSLEPSDFIAPPICPVLGKPIEPFGISKGYCYPWSASIDRMDPKGGYVKWNVKIISSRANTLKRDCTDPAELRAVADYIERCNEELKNLEK